MSKSATDVMGEIVFSAVIDAVAAFRQASGGVPNALVRDVGAVHPNTTPADLPREVQSAIAASVRAAFARLQKEGYAVAPTSAAPRPPAGPRPPSTSRPPRGRGGPPPKPPVVETKRRPPPRGPKAPSS